jgi:RNA polymerase sigma-70 factor (ECF subfamily)
MARSREDPDAQLMLGVQAGDPDAFDTLFRRYSAPLVHFLSKLVRERARAEELAQDVFIRIYQARARYEPTARFSTYLFGIATRVALNDLDRAYRRRERPLLEPVAERLVDSQPDPDQQLDAKRRVGQLESAMRGLAPRQRAALLLRVEEGLGYEEIGAALQTSVASVKSLIHRARAELLAQMKESGE